MDNSHVARNEAERERLRALLDRLSEDDWGRSLGSGWTVSAALAHLAYWDQRALAVMEGWERDGVPERATDVGDAINDAMLSEWLAMPTEEAKRRALASAEAVDRKIAGLSSTMVEAISAIRLRSIDRSIHRREHLEEIERYVS